MKQSVSRSRSDTWCSCSTIMHIVFMSGLVSSLLKMSADTSTWSGELSRIKRAQQASSRKSFGQHDSLVFAVVVVNGFVPKPFGFRAQRHEENIKLTHLRVRHAIRL